MLGIVERNGMEDRKVWQRNRKNAKGEENTSAANVEKADKERIKELAKKKKEMQEELDELKGNTAKGKAASVLVFSC